MLIDEAEQLWAVAQPHGRRIIPERPQPIGDVESFEEAVEDLAKPASSELELRKVAEVLGAVGDTLRECR